jgi:cobalt/nickel transport protein
MKKNSWLLIILVIALAIIPLFLAKGAEFEGADGQAEEVIVEIHPDYEPWFSPLWEPPSGEIESLLFALQASLGVGFIAYFFGYKLGQRRGEKHKA